MLLYGVVCSTANELRVLRAQEINYSKGALDASVCVYDILYAFSDSHTKLRESSAFGRIQDDLSLFTFAKDTIITLHWLISFSNLCLPNVYLAST